MQYFFLRLGLVALSLVIIYIFASLFGPIPFYVKSTTTTTNDLFTVNGTGEETAVPDTAQFTVGVTKTAPTVEVAKDQVNTATNAIIDDLKQLGVPEKNIKTQNINTYPNQDFNRGNTITGYTVSQELVVKVEDVNLANKALDSATANGANQISGVTFTIADEAKKELTQKARKEAIADAKSKAQDVAKDAGIKLGKIVTIYVSDTDQPPMPFEAKLDSRAQAGNVATNLQPGENTVTVNVTLSYETL